nr:MAG TPA: hypothetical protein [Caudoviricetes sp.]
MKKNKADIKKAPRGSLILFCEIQRRMVSAYLQRNVIKGDHRRFTKNALCTQRVSLRHIECRCAVL